MRYKVKVAGKIFEGIHPVVEQAMKLMEAMAPKPEIPIDPNIQMQVQERAAAAAQKAEQEAAKLAQKEQADTRKQEADFMKLTASQQADRIKAMEEASRQQKDLAAKFRDIQVREAAETNRAEADRLSREKMNMEDNTTAMTIATAEIASGERVGLETGTGINPNP